MSVRSEVEAVAALEGGAEILDVKDPAQGSLGCPAPSILRAVCDAVVREAPEQSLPLTTALGECAEWVGKAHFRLPERVSMAKLGLAGMGMAPAWVDRWRMVRRGFEEARGAGIRWVAVAYADAADAESPAVQQVVDAAVDTECAGLLIDTWNKSRGRLFDWLDERTIVELAGQMHAARRFLAVAGRLRLEDVARLAGLPVDIVAVRSAACEGSDRRSGVTAERVAACRAALEDGRAGSVLRVIEDAATA